MESIAKRPIRPPIRSRDKVQRHMMVKHQLGGLPAGATSEKRRRQVREYRLRRELSDLKRSIRRRREFQSRPIHGIFSSFGHLNPSFKHRIGRQVDEVVSETAISLFLLPIEKERECVNEKKACKSTRRFIYIRNI